MSNERKGEFSRNFFSLQMQLHTLLEGAGGEKLVEVLDLLSELTPSEQQVTLALFGRVIERVKASNQRLTTEGDLALKRFEDDLFNDILASFTEQTAPKSSRLQLEVFDGGKTIRPEKTPIDLDEVRKRRKADVSFH